jgi:hypothetical protein
MKVGITIDMSVSFFSKGVNQNALYLYMLYKEMGHSVILISGNNNEIGLLDLKLMNIDSFNIKPYSIARNDRFDLIISLGIMLEKSMYTQFKSKNNNIKYVSYKCGNEFMMDTEMIIYGTEQKKSEEHYKLPAPQKPDAIWVIPQMENTNLEYLSFVYKQNNSTVVPFIWDPIIIESAANKIELDTWKPRSSKRIAVMEPNISIMKNLLHPIVSVDKYIKDGNSIDNLYLFASAHLSTNKRLLTLLKNSNSSVLKKIIALKREPTPIVLKNNADVILSWQIENNLNYLYFDAAWLGWPIVHNAKICKDIGYYYENQLASQASMQIDNAFKNHSIEWKNEQRSRIKRFTIENKQLIEDYRKLTKDVMSNNFNKYTYVNASNSIK